MKQLLDLIPTMLGVSLPPWAVPVALLMLGLILWPLIRGNLRTDEARKLVRRAARERGPERERLGREALRNVEGRPTGLLVVAEAAHAAGMDELAKDALRRLRATGKMPEHVLRLERAVFGHQPGTPEEALLTIERLLESGAVAAARERWRAARQRWPGHVELNAIGERIPRDS